VLPLPVSAARPPNRTCTFRYASDDGDADRIGAVDEHGRIVWGDEQMVVYARSILKERPGATIIGDVKCSQRMYDDIARGRPIMWKTGHSLINSKFKQGARHWPAR
jgi:phosphomannomutase